jgi:glycosyltransferase involved in cell wall biosynthesis
MHSKNIPLVTIGICAYNAEETIDRAIISALKQKWSFFEIIIVDDCSSDDTWNLLQEFASNNKVISIFHNEKNSGVAVSRNRILLESNGEFIAFFDDDDESDPDRIIKQYRRLVEYEEKYTLNNSHVVCHTARKVIYTDGSSLVQPTMGVMPNNVAPHGISVAQRVLLGENVEDGQGACPTCCQFARSNTYHLLEGFDPEFRRSEDTEFVIRLALAGGHFVGVSDPVVVQYMTHNSTKSLDIERYYHRLLLDKYADFLKAEGKYEFCIDWLQLKYSWLQRSYMNFLVNGVILLWRYPLFFWKRLWNAVPSMNINRKFSQFHSDNL